MHSSTVLCKKKNQQNCNNLLSGFWYYMFLCLFLAFSDGAIVTVLFVITMISISYLSSYTIMFAFDIWQLFEITMFISFAALFYKLLLARYWFLLGNKRLCTINFVEIRIEIARRERGEMKIDESKINI